MDDRRRDRFWNFVAGAHGFIFEIQACCGVATRRCQALVDGALGSKLAELNGGRGVKEPEAAITMLSELWKAALSADLAVLGARVDGEYRDGGRAALADGDPAYPRRRIPRWIA